MIYNGEIIEMVAGVGVRILVRNEIKKDPS